MSLIDPFPEAEVDALGQSLHLGVLQHDELLVGEAFAEEGATGLAQDAAQLGGRIDGGASYLAVETVGK